MSRQAAHVSRRHAGWASGERHVRVDGTVLCLDVSGFTRLSERLARRGRDSAEELTGLISAALGSQVDAVTSYDGDVLAFGGDALTVLFDGHDHERRAVAAAAAARDVMAAAGQLATSVGRVGLRVSYGLESGPVDLFLAGGRGEHLLAIGATVTAALACEGRAAAGAIRAGDELARRLWHHAGPLTMTAGRLAGVELPAARSAPPPLEDGGRVPDLVSGQLADTDPQHRRAVVAFVRLRHLDARVADAGFAQALDTALRQAEDAAERHALSLWGTDVDQDGLKLILVAGAPVSRGDNGDRMLAALLDIVTTCPLPAAAGVQGGRIFMSEVGSNRRRTWTVMGDTVNVAARLAYHAPWGAVLATTDLLGSVRHGWALGEVTELSVKGRHEPVRAAVITGAADGGSAGPDPAPLLGRATPLDQLVSLLVDAALGADDACHDVEVVGPPGIGKSLLVAHAVARLRATDPAVRVVEVPATTYAQASAYLALRAPLRALVGRHIDDERLAARALVERLSAADSSLVPWLPLIAEVWRLTLPTTPEVEALDPSFRRTAQLRHTVRALRALLPSGLFVVEDAHWLDEASSALLEAAAAEPDHPWQVLWVRRPGKEPAEDRRRIEVGPLSERAATELVRGVAPALSASVAAEVVRRADGNSLFLGELAVAAAAGADVDALPDTVEAAFAAQIDAMPPRARRLLRRASVLGARAPAPLALALLDEPGRPLDRQSRDALAGHLVVHGGYLLFRHALLQETAYAGLARAARRTLHSRAADLVLADSPHVEADERADLLSLHTHAAGRHRESWRFSREAAARALERGASYEAALLLERAVDDARRLDHVAPLDLRAVLLDLADLQQRIGEPTLAARRLAQAARLPQDPVGAAEVMDRRGRVQTQLGSTRAARRWYSRALATLDGAAHATPERTELLRGQVLLADAEILTRQAKPALMVPILEQVLDVARRWDAPVLAARAGAALVWAFDLLGDPRLPDAVTRSLQLGEECGDLMALGLVLRSASRAVAAGDPALALEYGTRARAVAIAVGDLHGAAMISYNTATDILELGLLDTAEELLVECLATWRPTGYVLGLAASTLHRGVVALFRGDPDTAHALFAEARELNSVADYDLVSSEIDRREVEALALTGDPEEALTRARRLRADPAALSAWLLETVTLMTGVALARLGRLEEARVEVADAIRQSRGLDSKCALARGLRIMSAFGGPDAAAMAREAADLERELGVLTVDHLIDPAGTGWLERLSDPSYR